ncbi:hypothetical protein B0H14DRAFT_3444679 [Mycena olivaceomarginata]|nr:hypothetical protein B0H14DRAFT_3444679 [Mycena olivaceomarginata]
MHTLDTLHRLCYLYLPSPFLLSPPFPLVPPFSAALSVYQLPRSPFPMPILGYDCFGALDLEIISTIPLDLTYFPWAAASSLHRPDADTASLYAVIYAFFLISSRTYRLLTFSGSITVAAWLSNSLPTAGAACPLPELIELPDLPSTTLHSILSKSQYLSSPISPDSEHFLRSPEPWNHRPSPLIFSDTVERVRAWSFELATYDTAWISRLRSVTAQSTSHVLFVERDMEMDPEKLKKDIIRKTRQFHSRCFLERITSISMIVVVPPQTLPHIITKGNIRRKGVEDAFKGPLDQIYACRV